jgi:hypothetical protein
MEGINTGTPVEESVPKTAETVDTKPVERKEKPRPINMDELNVSQRSTLVEGLDDAIKSHPYFKKMGPQQITIYYSTIAMGRQPEGVRMLGIEGEERWKVVGDEKQRFLKFKFNFVIPGTNSKLAVEKTWNSEDFK